LRNHFARAFFLGRSKKEKRERFKLQPKFAQTTKSQKTAANQRKEHFETQTPRKHKQMRCVIADWSVSSRNSNVGMQSKKTTKTMRGKNKQFTHKASNDFTAREQRRDEKSKKA
jgi:hypothetical protein